MKVPQEMRRRPGARGTAGQPGAGQHHRAGMIRVGSAVGGGANGKAKTTRPHANGRGLHDAGPGRVGKSAAWALDALLWAAREFGVMRQNALRHRDLGNPEGARFWGVQARETWARVSRLRTQVEGGLGVAA